MLLLQIHLTGSGLTAVGIITLSVKPASSADDAEEAVTTNPGYMYISSSDLELDYDSAAPLSGHQLVGVRFPSTRIPAGAQVLKAVITFTCATSTPSTTISFTIKAQKATGCSSFSGDKTVTSDISSRSLTSASATWLASGSWTNGSTYETSDFSAVIQEVLCADKLCISHTLNTCQVISQSAWNGDAICIVISSSTSGTGYFNAVSYDGKLMHLTHMQYPSTTLYRKSLQIGYVDRCDLRFTVLESN